MGIVRQEGHSVFLLHFLQILISALQEQGQIVLVARVITGKGLLCRCQIADMCDGPGSLY